VTLNGILDIRVGWGLGTNCEATPSSGLSRKFAGDPEESTQISVPADAVRSPARCPPRRSLAMHALFEGLERSLARAPR
jgi:hypothetical protein